MKKIAFFFACVLFFILPKEDAFALSDVKKTDYFYDAINWATKEGIISGYEDGTFRPHQKVTHRQFIKMYTNTFDFEETKGTAFEDYYRTLEQYGMEFFYSNQNHPISRGEVAILIAFANGAIDRPVSFHSYNFTAEQHEQAAQFMVDNKISTGQNKGYTNTADYYGSTNNLTRAHAITFLYRLHEYKLTTLVDAVKLYKEPFLFTEQEAVLRSYNVGNNTVYHVLADKEHYRLAITYKDYLIGGYETEIGKELWGYKIGYDQYQNKNNTYSFPKDGIYKNFHIDNYKSNTIRAISWWVGTPAIQKQIQYAQDLATSQQTTSIAYIYRDLANEFRAKEGVPLLEEHWVLTTAAKNHSIDMATRNYFAHYTPEGLTPTDRVKLVPNNDTPIQSAGENLSAGYPSIFHSHTGLINSFGHRQNLLNPTYQYIGYGTSYNANSEFKRYYTTKFAR